jgi:steroid delta-isomerase-like uncharacterized protein
LRAFIQGAVDGFPDLKFALTSQFSAGDWAAMEWTWTGTHAALPGMPATTKPFRVRGATIIELRDGKIKRNTDYWDLATLLKQVGLMPTS